MRRIFLLVQLLLSAVTYAQNTNYYVDAVLGKDQNPGTLEKPWASVTKANNFNFGPGDKLFFAGGQTFGQLELQSSDAGGLTIKSYNGTATLSSLYAYNVGDITIDGLNFKGPGTTGNNISGIEFYMNYLAPGDLANILIQNVSVTNFGGNGIRIGAWETSNGYNNVKVLNSKLYLNATNGLVTYGYNDEVNHTQLYVNNVKAYQNYGRTDITYTNTGSGILVSGFDGGVVENCEAYENGKNNRASGGGPQGFWCYNARNITFQYCVSHDNKAGRVYDGGGFDIDGGSQYCTIQYCYSYNNAGAGYAFFEHSSSVQFTNNTIRYNISQNDARNNAHGAIMMWARDTFNRVKNSAIHNNTIYVTPSATASKGHPVGVYNKGSNFKNISFYNNIIYTTDTIRTLIGSTTTTTYSNNNYYNPDNASTFTKGGVRVNPMFTNPGGGKAGYVLQSGSPMINTGKAHTVKQDIIGTPVPYNVYYDIGAYESTISPPAGTNFVKVNIYGGSNAYSNAEWTNWNVGTSSATNKTISALKYSDGTASTVGALLSYTGAVVDNGSTYGGTMAPAAVLRYASSSPQTRTLTLSGLSASKTYSLELYASRNNAGYSTVFTVNGTSKTIITDKNLTNKASFTGLTANASGQIVVNIASGASTSTTPVNYLNGFLLTENASTSLTTSTAAASEVNESASGQLHIRAYPNPSGDQFTLQLSGAANGPVQLRVVDVMGRIVEQTGRIPSNTTLTIGRPYSPGVYYAEVLQGRRKATVKLVKQPRK